MGSQLERVLVWGLGGGGGGVAGRVAAAAAASLNRCKAKPPTHTTSTQTHYSTHSTNLQRDEVQDCRHAALAAALALRRQQRHLLAVAELDADLRVVFRGGCVCVVGGFVVVCCLGVGVVFLLVWSV